MVVSVATDGDIEKVRKMSVNIGFAVEALLTKISQRVQNYAKENAPVGDYTNKTKKKGKGKGAQGKQWGTLKKSITHDRDRLKSGIAIVGSPVAYSRRREYENNLHPWTKFYLKRWYTEHVPEYKDIIKKALSEKLN